MSYKKPKYCSVIDWVKSEDEDFAEVIKELCLDVPLRGSRNGVTFIFPEKKVRDDIKKKARTKAGIDEALTTLEGHILAGVARTVTDFGSIGTLQHLLLPIEKASGSDIILVGGTRLKPADSFIPLRANSPTVVWVADGVVPPGGAPAPRPQFAGKRRRGAGEPKVGGAPEYLNVKKNFRAQFAKRVEEKFDEMLKIPFQLRTSDPYLNHSVSLLNFLKITNPQLLACVLPLIDREPATTYYLLVEPYKTEGSYLIPDDLMKDWGNNSDFRRNTLTEYEAFFEQRNILQDPATLRSAIDEVRMNILGDGSQVKHTIRAPNKVLDVYQKLMDKNQIMNLSPVFPNETLSLVQSAEKKVWQDEMRFFIHGTFASLRNDPIYKKENFEEAIRFVYSRRGNDYAKEALSTSLGLQSVNSDWFEAFLQFVNSTDFLYFPVQKSLIGDSWGDIPVSTGMIPNPNSEKVFNVEHCRLKQLESFASHGFDKSKPANKAYDVYAQLYPSS